MAAVNKRGLSSHSFLKISMSTLCVCMHGPEKRERATRLAFFMHLSGHSILIKEKMHHAKLFKS